MVDAAITQLDVELKGLVVDDTPKGQLYASAKKIYHELVNARGTMARNDAKEMILGARALVNEVNAFVANAEKVASVARTTSVKEQFKSTAYQVKHYGVQLKMLMAVRAAGSAAQQEKSEAEGDQFRTCVKGIVDNVIEVVQFQDIFDDEDPFAGGFMANTAFSGAAKKK